MRQGKESQGADAPLHVKATAKIPPEGKAGKPIENTAKPQFVKTEKPYKLFDGEESTLRWTHLEGSIGGSSTGFRRKGESRLAYI